MLRSIKEGYQQGWLPFTIVSIECSSLWIGAPDVHLEHVVQPITNIDPDGGLNSTKLPIKFIHEFIETPANASSFEFIFKDKEHQIDQWEGTLIGNELFIKVPNGSPLVGIKEGFVSLLDYAEESLMAANVILCLSKDMNHLDVIMRSFRSMGFELHNPNHVRIMLSKDNYMFMRYEIK